MKKRGPRKRNRSEETGKAKSEAPKTVGAPREPVNCRLDWIQLICCSS
jgi:hypothetical protein